MGNQGGVFKTVASIGWNPYFKNEKKTVEPHLIHEFKDDFYDQTLKVVFCGFLRPEMNFNSLDELKAAIHKDIEDSKKCLDDPQYQQAKSFL